MSPNYAAPFTVSLLLIACTAPATLETAGTDIAAPSRADDPPTPAHSGAPSSKPPPASTGAKPDAGPPARVTGCPASVVAPIFCDSFEGKLEPSWNRLAVGGDVDLDPQRGAAGSTSLRMGFAPLPGAGLAQVEHEEAGIFASPQVSLRFQLFLPRDAYPAKLPLGGLYNALGAGIRLALDSNANLVAEDVRPDPGGIHAIASFPAAFDRWACVVIGYDRATGIVSFRTDEGVGFGTSTNHTIDRATLGLTYSDGANDNASLVGWYDDVTISAGDLACP